MRLNAISVHIGSQILSENPFKKTLKVLEEIINKTKINFEFVDLGGGFGITYKKNDKKINLKNYSNLVEKFRQKYNCSIIFEPGRAIVGNAAILVTKVQYLKKGSNKTFAVLNAGMNDFMRTALYDAVHNIIPVVKNIKKNKGPLEFVGPICETTCKFIKYNKYQKLNQSDYVAISDVGAYGASLSSNYNTKPFIAEIIINKSKTRVIRKKQDIKAYSTNNAIYKIGLIYHIILFNLNISFILAIPTLILPSKTTLICGKILAYIIIFLLRFILGVKVTFSGVENLKKNERFLLQVHTSLYLKHLYSKLLCDIPFLF